MKAAVTGANGHLGSTLCSQLLEQGAQVVACLRKPHSASRVPARVSTIEECNLADESSLKRAFAGCRVVFHTAAPTQLWSRDPKDIETPIHEGTLNVIHASARAGVEAIIYTSSCAAVGFKTTCGEKLNEGNYNENTKHPQFRAKLRAERDGEELALRLGIKLIRVCVPSVVGPGFKKVTPSVEPYVQIVQGRLAFVPELRYSLLDVRDLAAAQIRLSMARPLFNRYIVAGHEVSTQELLEVLASLEHGLTMPKVISKRGLSALAFADAALHFLSLRRTRRRLTFTLVRECAGAQQRISAARFCAEFPDWKARPLLATLQDTLSWVKNAYA